MKPTTPYVLACVAAVAIGALPAPRAADSVPVPPALVAALATRPFAGQGIGVYAVSLESGKPLAGFNPDLPLVPASTMKVLTGSCALEVLGPSFTWRTRLFADQGPDAAGVVHGALYVQGSGDPSLRPEDLWAAVRDLAATGIKRIDGDVVLDDTLFEPPGRPAAWPPPHSFPVPYDAPQGALSLAWNSTEIVITGGTRAGESSVAETSPIKGLLAIENLVRTGAKTSIVLARTESGGPSTAGAVRLTGTIARGARFREWIHLGNPTDAVRAALMRLLPDAGITVRGSYRRGVTAAAARLLVERRSAPLPEVLTPVLKHSSNFGAEMVARTISSALGTHPATIADGSARLLGCLDRWQVARTGITVTDGSGLGRGNRLTARALVGVLTAAHRAPWNASFEAALPVAGEDGSLERRLRDLKGRVRAKTGTIDDVAALAGYATTPGGRHFAFAILLNRHRRGVVLGHPSVDRILRALIAAADGKSR